MARGSTQVLIRRIIENISKKSMSVKEIADNIGMHRTAITRYLNILKESGLLLEEHEGKRKKFSLSPVYRTDTYFGLPLDEKTEKEVNTLFYLIRDNWKKYSSNKLLKTNAQKIAYKVIISCNLNIPCGWYIYGGISVPAYNDSIDYHNYGLSKEVENCVEETTQEYAKNKFAWKIKKQQYEEFKKKLYDIKEGILSILYSGRFDEDPSKSISDLIKKVRKLISLAPRNSREKYNEILDSYQDLMLDVYNSGEEFILENKREIILLFESIWKYIALFNFKNDLRKYYPERVLEAHFKLDISQQEDDIVELGTELQSRMPKEESMGNELKDALSKMKILSPEEKEKRKEEIDKLRKEMGEEEFQKHLLKEFGLK